MGTTLYERDFYAWTREQAERLRDLRGDNRLDAERLAEEIEDLGRSERSALRSQFRRLIAHLLKLRFSPATDPRPAWRATVSDARAEIADRMTPSLRADIEADLERLYAQARRTCAQELEEYGERPDLPVTCPYRLDQLLDEEWYPEAEAER
jgi:Domain of unknown function DUF29